MTDSLLGRPLWYELLTTDSKAAANFYSTIVGWTTKPFEGANMPYTIAHRAGDVGVAGIMSIPPGMNFPPHWGMYIGVPNLEDGVKRVQQLGGSTLSPVIDVPNVGRMQTMKDPQGAAFSIFEPAPSSPNRPETKPELGDISWHELYTTDVLAAKKFYFDAFGWKDTESFEMGPMGTYHMFGRHDWSMGGMMNKPKEMAQVPNHWLYYFRVPDVHGAAEKVKANGGQVLNTMEVPGGDWIAQCLDPQGAAFAVHQVKR